MNRLGEAGYACLVAASGPLTEGSALPSLLRRGVEAVIFVGATPGPADMETLAAQVVPWVALAEGNEADPHRIDLGSDAGRELATRYLAELSHEQLAFLGVGCQGSAGAGQPVAIGADGRAVMRSTGVDRSEVKLAVGDLLAASDRPTAIICGSDTDAVVALRECVLRGIRVPEELSIIGFGDESFARHTVPALSTVRCAWTEIGVQAATSILSRIEGRAVEPYKPAVKLVIRESTGPAP